MVEGLLEEAELAELQAETDREIEQALNDLWDPGDSAPSHPDDAEIEAFFHSSYPTCPEEEYGRIMRLVRHTATRTTIRRSPCRSQRC